LLPAQKAPGRLAPLVGGVIDTEHITARWDQLLRLATSIRTGTTTSSAMLKKLSAYPRQNGLAKALREIGTLFTLDWIKNPDLRRRAHLGLNKGEARNALARAVYFCRLGEVRDHFIGIGPIDHYINGNLHNLPIDGADFNVGYKHTGI
jgi:TnpA family transposase